MENMEKRLVNHEICKTVIRISRLLLNSFSCHGLTDNITVSLCSPSSLVLPGFAFYCFFWLLYIDKEASCFARLKPNYSYIIYPTAYAYVWCMSQFLQSTWSKKCMCLIIPVYNIHYQLNLNVLLQTTAILSILQLMHKLMCTFCVQWTPSNVFNQKP